MTTRIKLRRDTAANWTSNNPILAAGEPGLETDTDKIKYGDGTTHWADLDYATGGFTSRSAVGNFLLHGDVPNNVANRDWWFESVEVDPDGNAYYVGGSFEYNDYTGWTQVVKVDVNGDIQWQKEVTWPDAWEGRGTSAVYNTATDQLVVFGAYQLNNPPNGQDNDTLTIMTLDAGTGALVGDATIIRDETASVLFGDYSWFNEADIALTPAGDYVVVGSLGYDSQVYNVTTQTGSGPDVMFVDASVFPNYPAPYSNWYITGTNINNAVQITAVNEYNNIVTYNLAGGTGTDATFNITADGSGGYTVGINAAGSGYVQHNRIKVLGSLLGGADGTNDATVVVDGTDAGAITSVSVNGTSVGSSTYTGVSGTNVPGGYNFLVNDKWRMKGPNLWYPSYSANSGFWTQQQGNDYAVGDTVYVNPEDYGGLTSATITITAVGGSGEVQDFLISCSFNTATVKLFAWTGFSNDYSQPGDYQVMRQDEQAFVLTPNWQKSFGDTNNDKVLAVDVDSQGNIYTVGYTYDLSLNDGTTRGVLVKLDSSGNMLWNKNFDPEANASSDDGYTGVVVDGDDNVIVANNGIVTKVDGDGVVLWQKWIGYGEMMGMWNTCVDVDTDNNIYVNSEYDYAGVSTGDNFLIVKLDTDGNVLYQREAGTTADENTQWNNGYQTVAVGGGRFALAGSSYQGNDDVALAINMPTDGSGASENYHGRFLYREMTWPVTTSTAVVQDMYLAATGTNLAVSTTGTFVATDSTWTNTQLYVRSGTGGTLDNVYSMSFEDGSVQTTAYIGGLAPGLSSPRIHNTNNYYLTLGDAGRMTRWYADGWNDTQNIYIPNNNDVPFAIGTQMHFMKDSGIRTFRFWNGPAANDNDITIIPASPADYMYGSMYNSGEGWSVHHPNWDHVPCIVTLTKIDTNRWLLSCNSPTHIMDWSY